MVLVRVHRGETLILELEWRGSGLRIGWAPDDDVRLEGPGLGTAPGPGGLLSARGEEWVFVPRDGGADRIVEFGSRFDLGGYTLELVGPAPGARVALDALAADPETDVTFQDVAPRPGSHAARLATLGTVLLRVDETAGDDAILARALDGAFDLVDVQRGLVALLEPDGRTLRVVASRRLASVDPRETLSRRVLEAVLGEGRDVVTGNAPLELASASVTLASVRALCALPLRIGGRVAGVLYVDRGLATVPFEPDDVVFLRILASLVGRRLEEEERVREARRRTAPAVDAEAERMGWVSAPMRALRSDAERVGSAFRSGALPVLLTGESGTGKEVLARWLHERIAEKDRGPFVALNCAAIPHDLAESELFGIEQGVASGVLRRIGKVQQADGGTLFLDEVGEMSPAVQAKLLRVLETRRVARVGARDEVPVQLRLVSATNTRLEEAIRAGRFREDLYWRLNGVELHLPPLRDRSEDVPLLARAFAERFARDLGSAPPVLLPDALACLSAYAWPGNVRELKQRMGALVALCGKGPIGAEHLPTALRGLPEAPKGAQAAGAGELAEDEGGLATLAEVEQAHIRRVLGAVDGDRGRAAQILGIHRKTLLRHLDKGHMPSGESPAQT